MWQEGKLRTIPDSGNPLRLGLDRSSGGFHCGKKLEIQVAGQWLRGRIELGNGWYWTDNETNIPLRAGMQARVWDGLEWPKS